MNTVAVAIGLGIGVPLLVLLILALRIVLKVWGPSPLNKYDQPGEVATCDSCIFCRKINQNADCEFEDDDILVFHDKYPKSVVHLLVVPKRHIKNAHTYGGCSASSPMYVLTM